MALLEHEQRHVEQAQFPGMGAQSVDILLHAVADINHGMNPFARGFLAGMGQHLGDLGMAAPTVDGAHEFTEPVRVADPFAGPALSKAAKIDQLDVKPADFGAAMKHFGLKLAGAVPGRLPAHGGIEGEDEAPTLAGPRQHCGKLARLADKGGDFVAARAHGFALRAALGQILAFVLAGHRRLLPYL